MRKQNFFYCVCNLIDLPHQSRYWIDSSASRFKPISECNLWFFTSNREWSVVARYRIIHRVRTLWNYYSILPKSQIVYKNEKKILINNLTPESRWTERLYISLLVICICIDPREYFLLVYFRINPVVNMWPNFCVETSR